MWVLWETSRIPPPDRFVDFEPYESGVVMVQHMQYIHDSHSMV